MLSNFRVRIMAPLIGAFFISFSLNASEHLNIDNEWLRLLHAYPHKRGYQSESTAPNFFLAPDGRLNPQAELNELVKQVGDDTIADEDHPVCRFPARINWLKRHYPDRAIAQKKCIRFNDFKKRTAAKSASVVFSSYYLNNPSSSFGHTFIRIGKEESILDNGKQSLELLDTGINYGAATGDAGPLLYFVGGLNGHFSGTFTAVPYYYKVREYNDFETRDLWTYHLNLSSAEIEQLINHVWELGHNSFDYFFLSKNCSYHVLTIIEAVKPDVNLLKEMPSFYVIPAETLKVLVNAKLVNRITFRPSARTSFQKSISKLSDVEKKMVNNLAEGQEVNLDSFSARNKANILDSALGLIDYKYAKDILKKDERAQSLKRPLLIKRAAVEISSENEDFSLLEKDPPHSGHGANRLLIRLGKTTKSLQFKNFLDLEWRFASQDLLDNEDAYPSFNKLELGRIALRYDYHEKVQLKEFTFLDSYSLGTWNEYIFSPAWKIRAGEWLSEIGHASYQTAGFQGGVGIGKDILTANLFFISHFEGSYVYERLAQLKAAYGFDTGVALKLLTDVKFLSVYEWRDRKWDEKKWKNEIRWADRVYGGGFSWVSNIEQKSEELSFHFLRYF